MDATLRRTEATVVARKRLRDGWLDTRAHKLWKDWEGLTYDQRAERLGMSRANYIRLSDGATKPSLPTAVRLADVFGVTVKDLLAREQVS